MNDLYNKLWRLQHKLGMKGYGAYCRLVDLCEAFKSRGVPYDLEELARTVNERVGIVRAVVEEFALFRIVDGKLQEFDSTALSDDEALERRVEILERNLKAIELLTRYGVRGYGVFCRLGETCRAQGNRGVKYDLEELSDLLNEKAQFIKQIVEDRGLFELVDDEVRLCQDDSPLTRELSRKRQIRQNRRVGAQKGFAARRARLQQDANVDVVDPPVSHDLEHIDEAQPPRARGQDAVRKTKGRQDIPQDEGAALDDDQVAAISDDAKSFNNDDSVTHDVAAESNPDVLSEEVAVDVNAAVQTVEESTAAAMQTVKPPPCQQTDNQEPISQYDDFGELNDSDVYAAALATQTKKGIKCAKRSTKRASSRGKKQTREASFTDSLQQMVDAFDDFKNDPAYQQVMQRRAAEQPLEDEEQIRERHERLGRVRDVWNEIFANTRRTVHDLFYDALTWERFTASSKLYTDEDYREAFEEAKRCTFPWQFKDVIKPDNIQRLLTSAEIERAQAAQKNNAQTSTHGGNDNPMDSETLEVIQYGRDMGWN